MIREDFDLIEQIPEDLPVGFCTGFYNSMSNRLERIRCRLLNIITRRMKGKQRHRDIDCVNDADTISVGVAREINGKDGSKIYVYDNDMAQSSIGMVIHADVHEEFCGGDITQAWNNTFGILPREEFVAGLEKGVILGVK